MWKVSVVSTEYINGSSAPNFSGDSVKELFCYYYYSCEDRFRDAMETLGKGFDEYYFEQWLIVLHGIAKDLWQEVLLDKEDLPDNNGTAFDEDKDGFTKAMDQCALIQFYPRSGAKILQPRAIVGRQR